MLHFMHESYVNVFYIGSYALHNVCIIGANSYLLFFTFIFSMPSGLVFDGSRTMFVSSGGAGGRHYLYREDDLVQNRTCGVSGPSEHRASSIAAHQAVRVSQLLGCRPRISERRTRSRCGGDFRWWSMSVAAAN